METAVKIRIGALVALGIVVLGALPLFSYTVEPDPRNEHEITSSGTYMGEVRTWVNSQSQRAYCTEIYRIRVPEGKRVIASLEYTYIDFLKDDLTTRGYTLALHGDIIQSGNGSARRIPDKVFYEDVNAIIQGWSYGPTPCYQTIYYTLNVRYEDDTSAANLAISYLYAYNNEPTVEDDVWFSIRIENIGSKKASSTSVTSVWLDGRLVTNDVCAALFPDGGSLIQLKFMPLPAGEHTLRVAADARNDVAELYENDNDASITFMVQDYVPYWVRYDMRGGAALALENLWVSGRLALKGETDVYRPGYALKGWSRTPGGNADYAPGEQVGIVNPGHNEVITFYAVWEEGKGKRNLSLWWKGSKSFFDITCFADDKIGALPAIDDLGRDIAGWSTSDFINNQKSGGMFVTQDSVCLGRGYVSLTAIYADEYSPAGQTRVEFRAGGGMLKGYEGLGMESDDNFSSKASYFRNCGEPIGKMPYAEREGSTFLGWTPYYRFVVNESDIVAGGESLILYAYYDDSFAPTPAPTGKPPAGYLISCHSNYDNGINGTHHEYVGHEAATSFEGISKLYVSSRVGYTFDGWFTEREGGAKVTEDTPLRNDISIYAHLRRNDGGAEENPYVEPDYEGYIDFNKLNIAGREVVFSANGGTVGESVRYLEKNAAVGELPTPTWEKHVFLGWFTAVSGGTQVKAATKPTSNVTYYAHWQYVGSADDTTIVFEVQNSYEAEPDGTFPLEMSELVGSTSIPKLTVKGLPSGLKFDAKTGTISGTATKPGKYTVTVSATNATVKKPVTKTFELVVPNLASEVLPGLEQDTEAYGKIVCGVAFDPGLVGCAPKSGWALKASGLPTGLKLVQDKATGAYSITGVPTKAGSYTVTFTASKKGEKNQVATITLNVEALPTWAQGAFAGRVSAVSSKPPYQEYGSASMTVAANGKISGKIALLGTNWTFKADSVSRVESGNGELGTGNGGATFVVNAVAKAGKATMPVVLRVASGGEVARDARPYLVNAKAEGVVDGTWSLALWRNVWKDKATAVTAKAELAKWEGLYTLSLEDGGYLSLTIGKDGNVKAGGKLSDGTKVSANSPLVYDEEYGWLAYFYTAPSAYKGGIFAIAVGFGGHAGRVTLPMGPARWTSRNPQATGAYGEGFSRVLDFFGAYYGKKPDVSAWSSATFDVEPPDGYHFDGVAPKVTVAQATGIFKGSCSFLPDGGGKAKKANFEGIVVLGAETQRGIYLWDAAGSYIDPKSNKPKTYKYKESHPVSLTP